MKASSSKIIFIMMFLLQHALMMQGKTGLEIIQENNFKESVPPLLTTKWAQYGGGENAMLPNVSAPEREYKQAKAGCGAVALAQIMKHWNYPETGRGVNCYHWQHPHTEVLYSRYADFSQSHYDWANMIDVYFNNADRTQEQIDAVAKLMYDIGIALEMQYKDWSTATQIEYISTVLKKNFCYNPYLRVVRMTPGGYSMDEWLTLIYRELSEGRPILMGANNDSGDRHIYVADGYDKEGKVHFNLGHAKDSENKYYDLTSPQRGDWLYDMRMIIGICPQEMPTATTLIHVSEPGTILTAIGGVETAKKICRLKVTGLLNKSDMDVLRKLSRADIGQGDLSEIGQLSYLDLSEASLVNDELPDSAFFCIEYSSQLPCFTLQTVLLPNNLKRIGQHAFRSCQGLYHISFPSSLETVGERAFFDCRYLGELTLPKSIKSIGRAAWGRAKADKIEFEPGNPYFYVENNSVITADGKKIVAFTGRDLCDYVVPSSVEKIEWLTFSLKSNLRSLTLPSTMSGYGIDDFNDYCPGIKDIYSYVTSPYRQAELMDYIQYHECVLHVPIGLKKVYEESYQQEYHKAWDNVGTIVEDLDPSNLKVEDTFADNMRDDTHTIYDINGRRVASSLLRNGQIVIEKGKKFVISRP